MAIQKNITIDGIDVPFKASAAVPRLYRLKFRRDIYQDFAAFSIYEILPQLIDLWGLNVETQVQSKKNIARLTDR